MNEELAVTLKTVYLHVFDAFATDPSEVQDLPGVSNIRHARELLGVLVNANLVSVSDVNDGEGDAWQVNDPGTYDTHSRDEAINVIDTWLDEHDDTSALADEPANPRKANPKERKMSTSTIQFKHCLCGCNGNVPPKSNFKPGHDARMAGQVARKLIELGTTDDDALMTLPSEQLRDKAVAIFDKAMARKVEKASRKVAVKPVKVATPAPVKAAAKPAPAKRTPAKSAPRKSA